MQYPEGTKEWRHELHVEYYKRYGNLITRTDLKCDECGAIAQGSKYIDSTRRLMGPVYLHCGHNFCRQPCMSRWLRDKHTNCPVCRRDLRDDIFRQGWSGMRNARCSSPPASEPDARTPVTTTAGVAFRLEMDPTRNVDTEPYPGPVQNSHSMVPYANTGRNDASHHVIPHDGTPAYDQATTVQHTTTNYYQTVINISTSANADNNRQPVQPVPSAPPALPAQLTREIPSGGKGQVRIHARILIQLMYTRLNCWKDHQNAMKEICGCWEKELLRRDELRMMKDDFSNMLENEMHKYLGRSRKDLLEENGDIPDGLYRPMRIIANAMGREAERLAL